MKTISQVAGLTGISTRTLQYYDEIGLLKPSETTAKGYRLYGDEALERLQNSKARWKKTADGLKEWKEKDVTPNQTLWDIDRFVSEKITEGELERLQTSLTQIREELEEERQETDARLRAVKKEEKAAREELKAVSYTHLTLPTIA